MPILTATVKSNQSIAKATRELALEPPQGFTFQPGQYVTLLVPTPDGKKLGRSYSIASPAGRTDIVLSVKIVPGGLGSTYIDGLIEGQQIEFLGPLGRFLLSSLPNDFLFVATGAGIAPFVPMIDALLKRLPSQETSMVSAPLSPSKSVGEDQRGIEPHTTSPTNEERTRGVGGIPKITLLLGFRHREDAFYVDRFTQLAAQYPQFTFVCCLSQPDDTWTGEKGRVTTYLQEHGELADNAQVYICGNGSMTMEVAEIAKSHGVPPERVFFEKYNNL